MGEAADYENMYQEMSAAERSAQELYELAEARATQAREAEFAKMPANWWQDGCPFKLKDVVYSADLKDEGKVVGLPTNADVADNRTCRDLS